MSLPVKVARIVRSFSGLIEGYNASKLMLQGMQALTEWGFKGFDLPCSTYAKSGMVKGPKGRSNGSC